MAQSARQGCVFGSYCQAMVVVASILDQVATGGSFIATSIAVGGFLAHAKPALAREADAELRRATVGGGLGGLAFAVIVLGVSALMA